MVQVHPIISHGPDVEIHDLKIRQAQRDQQPLQSNHAEALRWLLGIGKPVPVLVGAKNSLYGRFLSICTTPSKLVIFVTRDQLHAAVPHTARMLAGSSASAVIHAGVMAPHAPCGRPQGAAMQLDSIVRAVRQRVSRPDKVMVSQVSRPFGAAGRG